MHTYTLVVEPFSLLEPVGEVFLLLLAEAGGPCLVTLAQQGLALAALGLLCLQGDLLSLRGDVLVRV